MKCPELEMQPLEGMASVGTVDGIYQNILILLFLTFSFFFFFFWNSFRNKIYFVVQQNTIQEFPKFVSLCLIVHSMVQIKQFFSYYRLFTNFYISSGLSCGYARIKGTKYKTLTIIIYA